jgi:integrase
MTRSRRGRGEGGVHQRPDGLWVGTLSLGLDGRGKRKRRTVYWKTKHEALAKLDSLRGKVRAGTLAESGKLTVGQVLDLWLANLKSRVDAATYEARERTVRVHLTGRIGATKVDRIKAVHLEALAKELGDDGVGSWALRAALDVLDSALAFAARRDLIPSNPFAKVDKPRRKAREPFFLTASQAVAVRTTSARPTMHALVVTALGTGLRSGELLGLEWPDIDLDGATLTVRRTVSRVKGHRDRVKPPKTKASRRTIGLPPFVVTALRSLQVHQARNSLDCAIVFRTSKGKRINAGASLRSFRRIVRRANLALGKKREPLIPAKVRLHDLRHTHASLLLSDGHSLKAVSVRLGHANATITLAVYAHCLPDDDGKLVAGMEAMLG